MSTATVDAMLVNADALGAEAPGEWPSGDETRPPVWGPRGWIARARTLLPELAAVVREHRAESVRARELIGGMRIALDQITALVRARCDAADPRWAPELREMLAKLEAQPWRG